jgi:hypothetical protein
VRKGGFNPQRRNRNIGTRASGHGQDNSLTIPRPGHTERSWWEALKINYSVDRVVDGRRVIFIVEKPNPRFVYACTIGDICHLLSLLSRPDWEGLETFVFRQPTSKQARLKPSWGRIDYCAELFEPGKPPHPARPIIFLDAVNVEQPMKWSRHLDPDDQRELQRLTADGHTLQHSSNSILLKYSHSSVRNTQLYRTLPHEIGHWLDHVAQVERPSAEENRDYFELLDRYWARPEREREAFAHRYAGSIRKRLIAAGSIPFERIPDPFDLNESRIHP